MGKMPPRPARAWYARPSMDNIFAALEKTAADTVEEVGKKAEKFMKDRIDKAVTPWGLYRMSKGQGISAGRRLTGKMYDNVTYRVEQGPKRAYLDVGWVKSFGPENKYFSYQETGFDWMGTGRRVEGAMALNDTRQYIKQILADELKKSANKNFRGGGR